MITVCAADIKNGCDSKPVLGVETWGGLFLGYCQHHKNRARNKKYCEAKRTFTLDNKLTKR